MALFQIKEPTLKQKSKVQEEVQSSESVRAHVVGIDLGTTHSLVATVLAGKLTLIPDEQGKVLLPSCIHVSESGQKLVGYSALKYLISDAYNTLFSIKRFMGKAHHDFDIKTQTLLEEVDGQLKIKTHRGSFYPIELSSEILRVLKLRAEKFLGAPVEAAVITVPAYFDDAQRIATKQAAQIAGLKVLRLINEPTAAAMAYGLETSASGTIAVYDFGGGTFDVSLLRLEQGIFEVLSTKGDTALGGDDIDILVAQWIVSQFVDDVDAQTCHAFWRYALGLAKEVKHRFTDAGTDLNFSVDIEFSYEHHQWSGRMSLSVFHDLIFPVIQKTLKICQRACHDAQIALSDIKHVVLVGGSTRTPSVVKAVTDFFKQVPLCSLSPDTVVAEGAALQADMLSGHSLREQVLLLDVNPLSLGLETMGGVVEKIIPRNSVLPITKTQSFTTYQDGQRALSLHILQGEREKVEDNRSLAKFILSNLPDMPAGIPKIDVTFTVDIDGLLTVRAEEQRSKVSTEIEIKPTFGLSDESIYAQIKEAIENASSDIKARKHRERVFEANQLLKVIESGLKEDADLLSIPEKVLLDEAIAALKEALYSDNTSLIYNQTQQLEKASEDFIERRLNKGLNLYLKNQKV